MKITFICPATGKKKGEKYIKSWKMEPLTVSTLKALTPVDVETEFFDDRLELIDYDTITDLVAMSVETYSARRCYEISERFKKRGVKVVLGGYHVTLVPEEAAQHADAVVISNAEKVWHQLIDDFKHNTLKKFYKGTPGYSDILPDRSIYADKNYTPMTLVETGRGCPFHCEFCAITSYYNEKYCPRKAELISREMVMSNNKYFFFVDDNLAANPGYLSSLCDEIAPLKKKWTSQASLTIAKKPELLKKMKDSGCQALLIGFESLEKDNLNQMKKEWCAALGERDELVQRIHDAGISIYATFVFGFDYDTQDTFHRAVEFSLKHNFFFAAFNHLLPFPGTALYKRLMEEGRLINEKWWLDGNYKYGDVSYMPKNMTPDELKERCLSARKEFFKYSSIFKRGTKLFTRNSDPLLNAIFWTQNINLKMEVVSKYEIPVGGGLDELPK